MSSILLTGPSAEALSLGEAKTFLRVEHGDDDQDYSFDCRAIDTQGFVPDRGASVLAFVPWAVPAPGRAVGGIELDVSVGFGDAAADLPESLRQAIRLLVSHWYDNRGIVAPDGQRAALPSMVASLITPYRMLSI